LREELGKTAGDHSPLQHGHLCVSLFFDARWEFAGDSLTIVLSLDHILGGKQTREPSYTQN
jgi:hypothetical protein